MNEQTTLKQPPQLYNELLDAAPPDGGDDGPHPPFMAGPVALDAAAAAAAGAIAGTVGGPVGMAIGAVISGIACGDRFADCGVLAMNPMRQAASPANNRVGSQLALLSSTSLVD